MPIKFQLNREKLKEAVWLIASYCPVEDLGNVKLHKILYFSDMFHFLQDGQPITGEDYQKQKFGPTSRHLSVTVSSLISEEKISVTESEYYGMFKKNYNSIRPYEQKHLSTEEIAFIKSVTDMVRGYNAKEISEISHNAAWEAADMGEIIPYFTALQFIPTEISDSDIQWAIETAKTHALTAPF